MTDIFNKSSMKSIRRELRQTATEAEEVLWEQLRERRFIGLKFKRQVSIGNFVVDFYCPSHELVVEIDGSVHDDVAVRENDELRQQALESLGLTVIRITNDEVGSDMEAVLEKLRQFLIKKDADKAHVGLELKQ
ncbi:MAG: endonuclease domain-containing protein [Cytophagales bacterium]|nr:MAG: endonuclease domain-containing protein [Cytophagales bacterium]